MTVINIYHTIGFLVTALENLEAAARMMATGSLWYEETRQMVADVRAKIRGYATETSENKIAVYNSQCSCKLDRLHTFASHGTTSDWDRYFYWTDSEQVDSLMPSQANTLVVRFMEGK